MHSISWHSVTTTITPKIQEYKMASSHQHPHSHSHPHQHQQGPPPAAPMPTEEQMALSDANFRAVPLAIDPSTNTLSSPTHDMNVLNALVRSLSALPAQIPIPPPPNIVPPQRSLAINKAKEDGNSAFGKKNYVEAIRMFTLAIDIAASRPLWENNQMARDELAICLANRSAALGAVGDWVGALCDAEACTKLKKPWPKAHFRKGKALQGLGRTIEAREAFELGLQFDPRSVDLREAIKEVIAAK